MNKRDLRLDKFGISGKRYKELCGFCEQYPEWKKELHNYAYLPGIGYSKTPTSPNRGTSDMTAKTAIRLSDYQEKCNLIERIAKQADNEIWEFIIKSVCYEVPITYLISYEGMHMSKSAFYERRRFFFYLLDQEKDRK